MRGELQSAFGLIVIVLAAGCQNGPAASAAQPPTAPGVPAPDLTLAPVPSAGTRERRGKHTGFSRGVQRIPDVRRPKAGRRPQRTSGRGPRTARTRIPRRDERMSGSGCAPRRGHRTRDRRDNQRNGRLRVRE